MLSSGYGGRADQLAGYLGPEEACVMIHYLPQEPTGTAQVCETAGRKVRQYFCSERFRERLQLDLHHRQRSSSRLWDSRLGLGRFQRCVSRAFCRLGNWQCTAGPAKTS